MNPSEDPIQPPAQASARPLVTSGSGLLIVLILVPIAMLLIGMFVLPQMYQFWCKVSGTQQRPNNADVAAAPSEHTGRRIKVYFEATVCDSLPVRFWADKTSEEIEVGVDNRNLYHFHNLSDHVVRFRPVHYVSPLVASTQFGMKVCFCFNDQVMQPGETKEYPVVFAFAPSLDERVKTVSICYTLFQKVDGEEEADLTKRIETVVGEKGAVVSPRKAPTPEPPAPEPAPGSPAAPASSAAPAPASEGKAP